MDPIETSEAVPTPIPEAPPAAAEQPKKTGESTWELVRSLFIILIAVFCIRTFIGEVTLIPTGSMENTILVGDHVILDKLLYGPSIPYTSWRLPRLSTVRRGDVIAFRYPLNPSVMYVKRAIAKGGDVIRIVNKRVYLNGKLLREP